MSDGVDVHIDFRHFINYMKGVGEKFEKSVQDPDVKIAIYTEIANGMYVPFQYGIDSGALDASTEFGGGTVSTSYGKAFTPTKSKHGYKRYAQGWIDADGIHIDPIENRYDSVEHYAKYAIKGYNFGDFWQKNRENMYGGSWENIKNLIADKVRKQL